MSRTGQAKLLGKREGLQSWGIRIMDARRGMEDGRSQMTAVHCLELELC
jgi:hypothetical protein